MSWECTCSVNSLCKKDVIDTYFRSLGDERGVGGISHFMGCSAVNSKVNIFNIQTRCAFLLLGCRRYILHFIQFG